MTALGIGDRRWASYAPEHEFAEARLAVEQELDGAVGRARLVDHEDDRVRRVPWPSCPCLQPTTSRPRSSPARPERASQSRRRVAQASRPWRARERREAGKRGMAGPDSAVAGCRAGAWRAPDRGRPRRDVSRVGQGRGHAATGGSRERRSAARRRAMDAGSVTTARTVMRPAHPVQRLTSTSKVRRKRVAQSTRESGA